MARSNRQASQARGANESAAPNVQVHMRAFGAQERAEAVQAAAPAGLSIPRRAPPSYAHNSRYILNMIELRYIVINRRHTDEEPSSCIRNLRRAWSSSAAKSSPKLRRRPGG